MLSVEQLPELGRYDVVGTLEPPPHRDAAGGNADGRSDGEGRDLTCFLGQNSERPPIAEVLGWADQMLAAVHELHTQPISKVHGHINPSSIRLGPDSAIQLAASKEEPRVSPQPDPDVSFKPLEQIWDGLDHLSQRVILDRSNDDTQRWLTEPLSPASDIYSIGATIFAVATGIVPPDALDRAIATIEDKPDPLPDPSAIDPSIPPEISEVILKAMALRRDDRYYSALLLRQVFKTAAVRVKERLAAEAIAEPTAEPIEATGPAKEPEVADETADAHRRALRILSEKAHTPPNAQLAPASEEDPLEIPEVERQQGSTDGDQIEDTPLGEVFTAQEQEPEIASARSWRFPAIGAAAAVTIAAVVFLAFNREPTAPPTAPTEPEIAIPAQPQTVLQADPLPTGEAVTENSVITSTSTLEQTATREKQNRPASSAVQEKPKKGLAPAAAKPQPTKKQLTVDDLINDH